MKIVIDISEEDYKSIKRQVNIRDYPDMRTGRAITNGVVLPSGHGRLIDADKLLNSDGIIVDNRKCHYIPIIDIYEASTIIEADKGE